MEPAPSEPRPDREVANEHGADVPEPDGVVESSENAAAGRWSKDKTLPELVRKLRADELEERAQQDIVGKYLAGHPERIVPLLRNSRIPTSIKDWVAESLLDEVPESDFPELLRLDCVPVELKGKALAHFFAQNKRLPKRCEALYVEEIRRAPWPAGPMRELLRLVETSEIGPLIEQPAAGGRSPDAELRYLSLYVSLFKACRSCPDEARIRPLTALSERLIERGRGGQHSPVGPFSLHRIIEALQPVLESAATAQDLDTSLSGIASDVLEHLPHVLRWDCSQVVDRIRLLDQPVIWSVLNYPQQRILQTWKTILEDLRELGGAFSHAQSQTTLDDRLAVLTDRTMRQSGRTFEEVCQSLLDGLKVFLSDPSSEGMAAAFCRLVQEYGVDIRYLGDSPTAAVLLAASRERAKKPKARRILVAAAAVAAVIGTLVVGVRKYDDLRSWFQTHVRPLLVGQREDENQVERDGRDTSRPTDAAATDDDRPEDGTESPHDATAEPKTTADTEGPSVQQPPEKAEQRDSMSMVTRYVPLPDPDAGSGSGLIAPSGQKPLSKDIARFEGSAEECLLVLHGLDYANQTFGDQTGGSLQVSSGPSPQETLGVYIGESGKPVARFFLAGDNRVRFRWERVYLEQEGAALSRLSACILEVRSSLGSDYIGLYDKLTFDEPVAFRLQEDELLGEIWLSTKSGRSSGTRDPLAGAGNEISRAGHPVRDFLLKLGRGRLHLEGGRSVPFGQPPQPDGVYHFPSLAEQFTIEDLSIRIRRARQQPTVWQFVVEWELGDAAERIRKRLEAAVGRKDFLDQWCRNFFSAERQEEYFRLRQQLRNRIGTSLAEPSMKSWIEEVVQGINQLTDVIEVPELPEMPEQRGPTNASSRATVNSNSQYLAAVDNWVKQVSQAVSQAVEGEYAAIQKEIQRFENTESPEQAFGDSVKEDLRRLHAVSAVLYRVVDERILAEDVVIGSPD
jgi:hypothetical protein